ncbi:MAG: EcoAI/FtnUII family type I restriction enzme subunit R [Leptospirales bacterium]
MEKEEKRKLSESDICDLFITPAIQKAGWDPLRQIRREVPLTPGPVIVRGNLSARNKSKIKFADYVLSWEPDIPVAIVEAKINKYTVSHGMQQALGYAKIQDLPSAFSSNGDAFASHNKTAGENEDIETQFPLEEFPPPEELWKRYKKYRGIEDEAQELVVQPYHVEIGGKEARYYQVDAINRTVECVAKGQKRVLLVMATGTGKTYTTFQIIWRLWRAKVVKRVLFLADRNALIDQAFNNDFSPFGSVMTKIKNRKIDPAYEVHLGLYQAITGPDEEDKIFKNVSPDFFDMIVIDECHRGSANDDSAWREILDYFSDAVQVGLTATPKETKYVSNITYFGEPIYTYSLKQGIEDGFLAPYKVIRIDIDKDIYGWNPPPGMVDDLGKLIEDRTYTQKDMDRILVLNKRTKLVAERVMKFLRATDLFSKTIIFCEDIDHADRMRAAITNVAGQLAIDNPRYVRRITGDSPEGKIDLDDFTDSESKYPVVVTTSELLTTGIDAKTCKLIVLDKSIGSMTLFKQIIGRGTRIEEEQNKFFFNIMDFKQATKHFHDPLFDGEAVVIYEPGDDDDPVPPDPGYPEGGDDFGEVHEPTPVYKVRVSGVEAKIIAERIEYMDSEGNLVTESYKDFSRNHIQSEFASLDKFIQQWNLADKKQVILDELEKHGVVLDKLAEEVGKQFGDFDLICHIAYDKPPLTRKERANNVKKRNYFTKYADKARAVLDALLDQYADDGVSALESASVLRLKPFNEIGTPTEIIKNIFGGKDSYENAIRELEQELYKQDKSA